MSDVDDDMTRDVVVLLLDEELLTCNFIGRWNSLDIRRKLVYLLHCARSLGTLPTMGQVIPRKE